MLCSITENMVLIPVAYLLENIFYVGQKLSWLCLGHFQEVAGKILCIQLNTHLIDM